MAAIHPALAELAGQTGLLAHLTTLRNALLANASKMLLANLPGDPEKGERDFDNALLTGLGPAAAHEAISYAAGVCHRKGLTKNLSLNGHATGNHRLLQNDAACSSLYSASVRQFLLPRYAMLGLDLIVDPRHKIDHECGHPRSITPSMYRYLYDRDDVSARVVDLYPDECWAVDPVVYEKEDENETNDTPFEKRWKELCVRHELLQILYRLDKLAGVGRYGLLLLGLDDGGDLEKPVDEPDLLSGKWGAVAKKERQLLYLRPFDEYLSFIQSFNTDSSSPRYGLPEYYSLVFSDVATPVAASSFGVESRQKVHWSRVVHVADDLGSSLCLGTPRMQTVVNRLLDVRKVKGGSAEMFWKGAFPGLSIEMDPRFLADNPDFDEAKIRQQVSEYASGLERILTLIGVSAKTLAPAIVENPERYVTLQMQAIATAKGVPLRIFLGSESGKLSSQQDKLSWNQRLKRKLRLFTEPHILRRTVDRFVAVGVMPPPDRQPYKVGWADLNTPTDEDKANLALKFSQAISQYVASGMIHLMQPMDYFTTVCGMAPSVAKAITDRARAAGGFRKLLKVDPSRGSGVNGVRQDMVGGGKTTPTDAKRRGKPKAQKSVEAQN